MYLKGSKWSPAKPRRRANPLRLFVLIALVAGALYINFMIVPTTPPLFIPTATPTRSPESFLKDAGDLVSAGKIPQAILSYQEAIKADPKNPIVYVTLAQLQVMYGDYPSATENVQTALILNSKHSLAHAVLGWILGKQQKYLESESEINTALQIDANNALAYAYLAETYKDMLDADQGDYNTIDKATEASKKAVELGPDLLETHRARGLVLEVTGNYEEAIAEFKAALAMNENMADLYIDLARNQRIYPPESPDYGEAIKP